jgi:hypothetical protein
MKIEVEIDWSKPMQNIKADLHAASAAIQGTLAQIAQWEGAQQQQQQQQEKAAPKQEPPRPTSEQDHD